MKAIPKPLWALCLALLTPWMALAATAAAPAPAQPPAAFGPHASGAVASMPHADPTSVPAKKKAKVPPNSVKLVDLNKASTKELMTLPGIGQADAERIVAHRPYQVKSDLVNKKVLATGPYLAVRKLVVALPPGKLPKPSKSASAAKPAKG